MRSRSSLLSSALFGAALLASLLLAELVLRSLHHPLLEPRIDERSLLYRYDAELGWFPTENGRGSMAASRAIWVEHNADGFRDVLHGPKSRPRIAFLGDSFVWGYDVEARERFTDLLARRLTGHELLNLGVSGYGTDQEFLLLQRFFDRYQPDLVFLLFTQSNDRIDNSMNRNYGGYYKPYFVSSADRLELRGVPAPRGFNYFLAKYPLLAHSYGIRAASRLWFQLTAPPLAEHPDPTLAILRALRRYLDERHCELRLGIHGERTRLPLELQLDGFRYVDVENDHRFPFGSHWTPEGHAFVARKVYEFLAAEKLID